MRDEGLAGNSTCCCRQATAQACSKGLCCQAPRFAFAPGVVQALGFIEQLGFFGWVAFLLGLLLQQSGLGQLPFGIVGNDFRGDFAKLFANVNLRTDVFGHLVFVKDGFEALAAVFFAGECGVEQSQCDLCALPGFVLLGRFITYLDVPGTDAASGHAAGAALRLAHSHAGVGLAFALVGLGAGGCVACCGAFICCSIACAG